MKQLFSNWKGFLKESRFFDLSMFKPRETLSPKVWNFDKDRVDPKVREKLLQIAEDFIEQIKIKSFEVIDITLTGSLANYNWTDFSDFDLHIILDFKQIDENPGLVGDFFRTKSKIWNLAHDIKIKDHDVEIYVQDLAEPHASTGVYSLLLNRWVKKPIKLRPEIDENEVKKKAAHISDLIDEIENLYNQNEFGMALEMAKRVREKIRNFRKCGLQREGEYSSENLAFKFMRRNGYLRKLADLITNSYDKSMSIPPGKRDFDEFLKEISR
tara:strand:+ start:1148 stop:1957 length:810 start_codon:yes stop_codon:yes gene_type:complete